MSREMFSSIAAITKAQGRMFSIENIKYASYKCYLNFSLYYSVKYIVVRMFVTPPMKEIKFISI